MNGPFCLLADMVFGCLLTSFITPNITLDDAAYFAALKSRQDTFGPSL
jgi:hypothetical protein